MTEAMAIEAVRSVGGFDPQAVQAVQSAANGMDPSAVDAFQSAMAAGAPEPTAPIPFADRVAAAWRSAEHAEQGNLHRLTELGRVSSGDSARALLAMQYELATLHFNMEVTTAVAKKSSDAVTTLIKNG